MAMTLADVRAKYPVYAKVPDQQLADALYKKYYPTADRHEFDLRVGLAPSDNALQVLGKDIVNAPGVVSDQIAGTVTAAAAGINNLVNGTPQPGGPVLPPIIPGVVGGPDLSGSLGAVLPDNVKRAIGEATAKTQLRGELAQQQNAEDRQKIELPSNSPLATGNEVLSTVGEMVPAVALSLAAENPAPMIALGGAQSAGGAYTAATAPGFAAPGTPLVSDATAAQLHGFTPDEVDQIAANETGKVPQPFTAVSPNQALAAATQYGVVGGAAAAIGAGPLLKEGMPVFQRIVTEALVNAGVSAGSAALNSATDLAYTNPDLTVGQIVERVKGAAITGAAAGAVLGGGAALVHGARGRPAPLEPDVVPPPADAVAPEAAPVAPETPVVAPAPEPAAPPSEMVHRATEAVKATGQPVTPELVGTALHTMDPLGPFEPAQLPPEIVSHVEAWRTGNDQSVAKPITMADIARSGALHPETGVKTPALAIDQAILTKIPNADHGNFSVGDVLDAATNKNLVTDDSNFRALAERATGTPDVEKMTPVQLSALKHVIDGLPAHAEPTSIPIADAPPFGHEQLGRVQAALRQGAPYSAELVREQTGLTAKGDVDALRDALVRQGDLVKEGSNNFRPLTPDEVAARQIDAAKAATPAPAEDTTMLQSRSAPAVNEHPRVPRSQTLRRAQPVESETAPGGTSLNQIMNRGSFTPGVNHVPSYRDAGQPPRPVSNTVRTATATHLPLPTEDAPARRTPAITALKRIIGNRLFVGRVKGGKNVAGSYNTLSGAVRTRNFDDVETLWHEAAHWIDHGNRFKAIFAPLRDAHAAELNPLSYTSDPALVTKEGFAEYVRLWGTNYTKARDLAPNFTKAFETTLKQTKLWQDMTRAQNLSHKFYFQGPIASLTSKTSEATPLERFTDAIRTGSAKQAWDASTDAASLEYNRFIDSQHGLSAMEIALKGARGEGADSPYTLAVASRGTEGTTNAILDNGTATVAPNGDLVYDGGKGLKEIFAPVVKRGQRPFNDLMRYMAARRGEELGSQGREHLFTKEEIAANLALERKYPEFRKVFDEFQGFNHRMLDFLVQSNALTNEQRDNILQRNANWVPFNRVIEHVMNGGALNGTVVKELRGSSRDSRDIMQNILQSVTNNVQAARVAQIKARTYQTILDAGDDGAPWAVEIPAGDKRIQLSQQQMKGRIGEVLRALGHPTIEGGRVTAAENPISATPIDLDNMEALFQQFPEMATFWTRAQPPTNGNFIDSAILDGERRYFEIPAANALFIDTMTAINGSRMPEIKSDFVRGAFKLGGLSKRVQTRLITSMPQFWIRNLVRDNMDAAIQSQSGFRPVYDSIRGMTHDITKSQQQKLAELNGMYFSGQLMANTAAGRNRAVLDMPVQSIQEAALKAMNRYDSVVAIGEHSTRLGEYLRALDSGASMTEAAARGRTVTVDFAQMGSNDQMKLVASQTPFLNSSVQGNAQVAKALFQGKDGTMNFATPGPYMKLAGKLVLGWGGAMAAATAAIWVRNHNDKRYQALTSDQKSGAWHLYLSDDPADHGISIPKPYGAGFVFGDVVENLLDYSASHDGWGVAANLGAAFMQRFGVSNGIPGAIAPIYQGLTNTEWNGAPIVPDNLAKAPPYMQFRDSTPLIYDVVGQKLNISPLMAEHYVRGYLGYAAQVMEDSTQAMLWNKDQWGAMPFPPHTQDYLLHGVFQDHPDYRTKYTDAYYALRSQVTSMASAYKWARQNNVKDPGLFKGLSDDQVNQTLKSLGGRFAAMDKILGGFNQQVMRVKYDPKLSQQAKEQQIEALYAKHNDQLRTSYESVEATIKANGG